MALKIKNKDFKFKEPEKKSLILTLLSWGPRALSIGLVLFWLIVLIIAGRGHYFTVGIMVWVTLVLTTLIAWKNAPVGGGIFVIIGSGYLIFSMGQLLSLQYVLAATPLFVVGALFIIEYLYLEKKENEDVDDF